MFLSMDRLCSPPTPGPHSTLIPGVRVCHLRHGALSDYSSEGLCYSGDWHHGQRQGQGCGMWADGMRYEGPWRADVPHGVGRFCWDSPDGPCWYEGEVVAGAWEGAGVCVEAGGECWYRGAWKQGQRHGMGTSRDAAGNVYEGQWVADQREGVGTWMATTGERYQGEWAQGQRHGRGVCEFPDGVRFEGRWEADGCVLRTTLRVPRAPTARGHARGPAPAPR